MNVSVFAFCALLGVADPAVVPAPPADPAKLRRLFEVLEIQRISGEVANALETQHAEQVALETDPERRARKQAQHDRVAAFIRERFAWAKVEPLAVETYASQLSAPEVDGLLAFYATPVGQLTVTKLHPALLPATLDSMRRMEEAAQALLEAPAGSPPPAPPVWTPANPREAAAGELAVELVKGDFDARVKDIEAGMRAQLGLTDPAMPAEISGVLEAEMTKTAAVLRDGLTFEVVKPAVVRHLAERLTEPELAQLLADSRLPERRAQRAAIQRADAALQLRIQSWIREEIMPDLIQAMTAEER